MTHQKLPNVQYLPTIFTIFGITGDLARKKLIPAIYHLYEHGLLPDHIRFFGVAHKELSPQEFTTFLIESVKLFGEEITTVKLAEFVKLFHYFQGDFSQISTFEKLKQLLEQENVNCTLPHQTVFYLAVAPQWFIPIVKALDEVNLTGPCVQYQEKAKIVIEKPFGSDLTSAQHLNTTLLHYADEDQIYRMDHYLGKETVQNLLLFRFTNPVINDSWNPQAIDHIQITAAEDVGVEQRAHYYDGAGALRDMVQSHCLALLTLVLMAEPKSLRSQDIHESKQAALQQISLFKPDNLLSTVIRGQYEGYSAIPGVKSGTKTETYVALRLKSSQPEWSNVPIFIQTGKRLKRRATTISIHFTPCRSNICKMYGIKTEPNVLKLRIQPEEGISLRLYAKQPGFTIGTEQVDMDFSYQQSFEQEQPSAYERLIHDVIVGDQSLFPSTEEVIQQWSIIQPLLDTWLAQPDFPLQHYEPGSWGPQAGADLIAQHGGTKWHT